MNRHRRAWISFSAALGAALALIDGATSERVNWIALILITSLLTCALAVFIRFWRVLRITARKEET